VVATLPLPPLYASVPTPSTRFNQAQAIVWQINFIISNLSSKSDTVKKALSTATQELQQLSDKFGHDFDKYLLRELVEQIDLREPNKAGRDKTEQLKISLFVQELTRSS
jgi:hypothetical protein